MNRQPETSMITVPRGGELNVERQGPSECMLATIAALQGRPLAQVRAEACRAARVDKWDDLIYPPRTETYWQAIERVAGPDLYPIVHCRYAATTVPTAGEWAIPNSGRGVIVVTFRDTSHIMPWENGLIYDPMDPHPVTLQDWLLANPEATVIAVRSTSPTQ